MPPLPTESSNSSLLILTERIDDLPLLLSVIHQMQVDTLLDEHFPTHGNRQGLSLGAVTSVWLSHILSQANHKMSHVRPWAEARLFSLQHCVNESLSGLDLTDDRLADVLRYLSDDECWNCFEAGLNGQLLQVYQLDDILVRLDSTSASGYWGITEEGLFQFGHSKDRRPDLPQLKVMMATLDPLGTPIVTTPLPGNVADDPLYIPAVKQVRESLGPKAKGALYVGDSKMASLETRAHIAQHQEFYLCPLPKVQMPDEQLEQYVRLVLSKEQHTTTLFKRDDEGRIELDKQKKPLSIGEGFEVQESLEFEKDGQTISWEERRLVVYSNSWATRKKAQLDEKIERVKKEIEALNERGRGKRVFRTEWELREAVEEKLAQLPNENLLTVSYNSGETVRHIRGYGGKPARKEKESWAKVKVRKNGARIREHKRTMGWRVYVTNAPKEKLSLDVAIQKYRANHRIEGGFKRLKGQPLSLTPVYLQRDDHVKGLVRLLSIGLRVLQSIEFKVRKGLRESKQELIGVYKGNPNRATTRPSAELLLKVFEEITLTRIQQGETQQVHITPINPAQQHIISLLGFSEAIYQTLDLTSARASPNGTVKS